ncbi:MAG TPA: BON domain-containing protein [Opitutaceae bacterium]|nr:BON domain-containing protein [Opitutaceae bacterium]
MKATPRSLASLALLAGGLALVQFQTGCAGTATRESTGEYVDDASITTKVKAAFVRDPVVKALEVKVDTFRGTVQLSGFVDTAEQRDQAQRVAAGVPGVAKVQNNISLRGR